MKLYFYVSSYSLFSKWIKCISLARGQALLKIKSLLDRKSQSDDFIPESVTTHCRYIVQFSNWHLNDLHHFLILMTLVHVTVEVLILAIITLLEKIRFLIMKNFSSDIEPCQHFAMFLNGDFKFFGT